jgi:hypothetical protein
LANPDSSRLMKANPCCWQRELKLEVVLSLSRTRDGILGNRVSLATGVRDLIDKVDGGRKVGPGTEKHSSAQSNH